MGSCISNRDAGTIAALWLTACLAVPANCQVSVLTWHNDNARTGQNLHETVLAPANVNPATFGMLFTITVDGLVDAQPLYVPAVNIPGFGPRNVLYVVTENDSAYAFDADNGTQYWYHSLLATGDAGPSDDLGCSQVTPTIGATATPAIDPSKGPHGALYTVAMTKDASSNYHHRLHALDLSTGAELFGGPTEIVATYPGTGDGSSKGTVTFDPTQYNSRPGLLILNGVVYTAWGSHCDGGPYGGWVIGYNETTLARVSVLDLTPNGSEGGIWMAGAGPAADADGNIYLLTGNGTFDTTLSKGFPSSNDYGNAFVKISTSGGNLTVVDYFAMDNTVSESGSDTDFGSGGMLLLPPLTGKSGSSVSLAVGAGKDGNVYVVNQANMGKFSSSADNIYQQMTGATPGGVWSSPAWFNGTLYYGDVDDYINAFSFTNGTFDTLASSQSPTGFEYPGATPSISANGTADAIVWAAENTSPAVLHAYNAGNLATELYNSNQAANGRDQFGSGNKFIVPTIANGKVYVGTSTGVGVFGLLASVAGGQATPGSGSGSTQSLAFTFDDPNGFADLTVVDVLINNSLDGVGACYVALAPTSASSGSLYLVDDAGDGGYASGSPISLPSTSTLQNSQCTISATGSSVSGNGNTLTLTLAVTFAAGFSGNKVFYMSARNSSQSSTWQALGTWEVPGSASLGPSVGGVSPTRSATTGQTYTFTFTDTNGYADLAVVDVLTNNALNGIGACYVAFAHTSATSGYLYLVDNAGDGGYAAGSPIALPSSSTLSNSQCTINGAGSSVSASGNTLTLNLAITFSSSFAGNQVFYLAARNNSSGNSGWQAVGSVTVP
jgi:hypothetical protein